MTAAVELEVVGDWRREVALRLGFIGPVLRVEDERRDRWSLGPASGAEDALFHAGERAGIELLWREGGAESDREHLAWMRRLARAAPLRRFLFARARADGRVDLGIVRPGGAGKEAALRLLDDALWADLAALAPGADGASAGEVRSGEHLAHRLADVIGREGLTRRFFGLFRRHLLALEERWLVAGAPAPLDRYERRDLTLALLCRLLFVTFVARARGLAGRRDYLRWLVERPRAQSLYQQALRPLFFAALNRAPEGRPPSAAAVGDVPFLNGGLFAPIACEQRLPELDLPDEPLALAIHELFEGFEFSPREGRDGRGRPELVGAARPLVDPQMLGQVFEALMHADERRRSGSFYTPPLLVRRVSHELLGALAGEVAPGAQAWTEEVLEVGAARRPADPAWALHLSARLERARILDPAVGSGALLLGVLDGLTALRLALGARDEYAVRRRIIGHNLFGVDRKAGAVRLCELRMWLALVASLPAGRALEPLPNLDHHFRQGDSLATPRLGSRGWEDVAGATPDGDDDGFAELHGPAKDVAVALRRDAERDRLGAALRERARRLDEAVRGAAARPGELFGDARRPPAAPPEDPAFRGLLEERAEVDEALRALARDELPYFSFTAAFPEVGRGGGFDAVIGNPPWVRIHDLPEAQRAILRRRYAFCRSGGSGFLQQVDLSVPFVERALELVRPGGLVGLLVPAKLFKAQYARTLRRSLLEEHGLEHVAELGGGAEAGFAAANYPAWLRFRRGLRATGEPVRLTATARDGRLREGWASTPALAPREPGGPWSALPREQLAVIARMAAGNLTLAEYGLCAHLGVKTGCNEVFVAQAVEELAGGRVLLTMACGTRLELPEEWAPPLLQGRDVRPFALVPRARMLLPYERSTAEPLRHVPDRLREYFARHAQKLGARADSGASAPPWAVFRTAALAPKPRVVWRDIATRLEAAVLAADDPAVPLNTTYVFTAADATEARVLAALLNSAPVRAFVAAGAEPAMHGHLRFLAWTVERAPWPARLRPGSPDYDALARLAASGEDAQVAIDRVVSRLFGLTEDDLDALPV